MEKEISVQINNNDLFKSNPNNIEYVSDLIDESYSDHTLDNSFCVFKSLNNIFYLIYSNEHFSIISYDLNNNKIINTIFKAHEYYITNFRHFLDIINKRDLLLSISADDNNIKIWDIKNLELIFNIKEINKKGNLYSACIFNYKEELNIIATNSNFKAEPIKIYDLKGKVIKTIKNNRDSIYFIDIYYNENKNKIYILIGSQGYVASYDYIQDEFYHIYREKNNNECHDSIIIYEKDIIKLIESCKDGYIRIFNFDMGTMIKRIKVSHLYLVSISLWNEEYLFVGCGDKSIKLVEINTGKIAKKLEGHKNSVVCVKKINLPNYGECLISQGYQINKIKMWSTNNN